MLRNRLREETRPHHERLERRLALTSESFGGVDAYSRLLQRFYGFHEPLDRSLGRFADALGRRGLALGDRLKAPRIAQDLRALGLSSHEIDALPRSPELPRVDSEEEAIGCLYVVEGATLGGLILTRHFRSVLPSCAAATGFFAGYGADTAAMWKAFVQFLGDCDAREADAALVVSAAQDTFECLERWMTDARQPGASEPRSTLNGPNRARYSTGVMPMCRLNSARK